jgi:hypothetical protein
MCLCRLKKTFRQNSSQKSQKASMNLCRMPMYQSQRYLVYRGRYSVELFASLHGFGDLGLTIAQNALQQDSLLN